MGSIAAIPCLSRRHDEVCDRLVVVSRSTCSGVTGTAQVKWDDERTRDCCEVGWWTDSASAGHALQEDIVESCVWRALQLRGTWCTF